MNSKRNIYDVLKNDVCTGCGTCNNICPVNCIKTELNLDKGYYSTNIDNKSCINCGLCRKVCPVYTWDNKTGNYLVGNSLAIFSGFCSDNKHRMCSASGGITTSILIYLLQKKKIDAAVVAFRKLNKPLESELRIVTSVKEIYESRGSVYAPTSYYSIINKIIESPYKNFAIVGLPCQIEGITRLSFLKKELDSKIFMKFSLVCGHTPSIKGYEYSLKKLNINSEDIKTLTNRGDGWPGFLCIKLNNTKEIKIPYGNKYSWGMILSSLLFTPSGCRHCVDPTGYCADISICDAWMQKYESDNIGRNLILIRNERSLSIIKEMESHKIITLNEENFNDFIQANIAVFKEKLVVNKYRNSDLVNRYGFFSNIVFSQTGSKVAPFFIGMLLFTLSIYYRIFSNKYINNSVLFMFKTLKYLSQKWINLKKY